MSGVDTSSRREWMGLLARNARAARERLANSGLEPVCRDIRAPETGAVMVRGRAGGRGESFNLGEITVTRCTVRLDSGEVGHACIQGRDRAASRVAATIDALMQTGLASRIETEILAPMRASEACDREARRDKAAGTKVDFFTMVRGEDG